MQQELFPAWPKVPRARGGDVHGAAPPGPTAADQAHLSIELEAALIRELAVAYQWENHARFRKRLQTPVIAVVDTTTRLGQWARDTRTLELSRTLIVERPWPEVLSVLLHEMAHQFVDEVLQVRDQAAHGECFAQVCAERGIDGRAHGAPIPASGDHSAGDRVLARVRKLMALAASGNQHEAELAMRKAHELMLRHNIEFVGGARDYGVRYVGDPMKRLTRVDSMIAALLSEYFFVKVIQLPAYLPTVGRRGSLFELSGTAPNLDMASHVFDFLRATAERLWLGNRDDTRIRNGRDRLSYQVGVIQGFQETLRDERSDLRGTGLVWVGDTDLDDYYHARNPRITRRQQRVRAGGAHAAGREAGRRIVLHKPVTSGSAGGKPKLLR